MSLYVGRFVSASVGPHVRRWVGILVPRPSWYVGRYVGRLVCRSVGMSVGRYVGRSVCRSVGMSVCRYVGRYVDRSVCRSVGRSVTAPFGPSHTRPETFGPI